MTDCQEPGCTGQIVHGVCVRCRTAYPDVATMPPELRPQPFLAFIARMLCDGRGDMAIGDALVAHEEAEADRAARRERWEKENER